MKTNEELLEDFENAEFNAGFNSALEREDLSLSPKERYSLKELILERMKEMEANG